VEHRAHDLLANIGYGSQADDDHRLAPVAISSMEG
jgi:hypothetical protein